MNPPVEVMVVSRDRTVCSVLSSWLDARDGYKAVLVANTEDALHRYRAERPELVVLDVASTEGLTTLPRFRGIDREIPIVALSAQASTASVVEAMRLGAADVLSAPFNPRDVDAALSSALTERQIRREMAALQQEVQSQSRHTMLFGTGQAMAELRRLIDRLVDIDVPVLIRGESGTGKELVARALAAPSLGRGKPFVKINCATLPTELFEAELFGFERGAFTGAAHAKAGKFEVANGGTIFLDEVGEIPLHLQPKLLQVLQDGHFSRLGGHGEIHVIVRVIAATNRDLDRAVSEGRFRQDLHYRLNVIPMSVPPLRERRDDIPLLADFFFKRWAVFYKRRYAAISSEMMGEFLQYDWPGNIRELENLIKRTVVLGTEAPARKTLALNTLAASSFIPYAAVSVSVPNAGHVVESTGPMIAGTAATITDVAVDVDRCSLKRVSRLAARQAEATLIKRMLRQTRGNRKQAAMNLGISYKALLYKAKENGLEARVSDSRRRANAPQVTGDFTADSFL